MGSFHNGFGWKVVGAALITMLLNLVLWVIVVIITVNILRWLGVIA